MFEGVAAEGSPLDDHGTGARVRDPRGSYEIPAEPGAEGEPETGPLSGSGPGPGPARAVTRGVSRVLGVFGELLITLSVLIALYAVYELWWSNITAHRQTERNSAALLRTWAGSPAQGSAGPGVGGPGAPKPASVKPSDVIPAATAFGFLYIPALGADWRALIMQSVDRTSVLNTGAVGHYTEPPSALPWDATGNFALAGHRDGHGMIFRDLDRLAAGEQVYVQTEYGWFVYRLDREAGSVPIDDVGAVQPIPAGSGFTAPGRYITLTTCTPIYIDSHRLVWWGHLIAQTPQGRVPAGVTPIS